MCRRMSVEPTLGSFTAANARNRDWKTPGLQLWLSQQRTASGCEEDGWRPEIARTRSPEPSGADMMRVALLQRRVVAESKGRAAGAQDLAVGTKTSAERAVRVVRRRNCTHKELKDAPYSWDCVDVAAIPRKRKIARESAGWGAILKHFSHLPRHWNRPGYGAYSPPDKL